MVSNKESLSWIKTNGCIFRRKVIMEMKFESLRSAFVVVVVVTEKLISAFLYYRTLVFSPSTSAGNEKHRC